MRLTPQQTLTITQVVSQHAGEYAEAFLFGSRLNDAAKGGDVDILVEADNPLSVTDKARIKMSLERALGLPVDLVVHVRNTPPTPFQAIAQASAQRLDSTR